MSKQEKSQRQTQKLVYKYAIFNKNINKKYLQHPNVISTLNTNSWEIDYGKFTLQQWYEIFPHMQQCSAQTILFDNNKPSFIQQIVNVSFVNLKVLSLDKNCIYNIEPLSLLNCEHLQCLSLTSNFISELNCMNKFRMPALVQLFVNQNPVSQINILSKMKVHQMQFQILLLQSYNISNTIQQDLSVMVKVSSNSLQQIYITSPKRIKQDKVQQMIALKYPNISLVKEPQQ